MLSRRSLIEITLLLLALVVVPASADTIAIIGTGDVAGALGGRGRRATRRQFDVQDIVA